MISDILKIVSSIQEASDSEERHRLEAELQEAVHSDICSLFDDPEHPSRRRTFKSIRKSLAIFDDDPQRLRKILYSMGARPFEGEGEEALWHLPPPDDFLTPQRPRRIRFSKIYLVVGAAAVLAAVLGIFNLQGSDLLGFLFMDLEHCLEKAGENFVEANLCNERYSRR